MQPWADYCKRIGTASSTIFYRFSSSGDSWTGTMKHLMDEGASHCGLPWLTTEYRIASCLLIVEWERLVALQ